MRPVLQRMVVAAAFLLAGTSVASAKAVTPKSAPAFRDSIGVQTHIVYFNTAYGNWPRVVAKLQELGVRHLRDGVYGNPTAQWRDWNERYYSAVELAASHGMRFDFGMGHPGNKAGSLKQLIDIVGGRLRSATEALEAPNEFDHFVGGPRWPSVLRDYDRDLYREANARPSLRSLPILGPSLVAADGPQRLGNQHRWLDVGNIHPYTGATSPTPGHVRSELARMTALSGSKPVWATEAGYHNALHATTSGQPPASEAAASVYLLRTFLEHFEGGIARTYAYELVDELPDPGLRDTEQHFGLLRNDFSPKPAFTALRNLLAVVGTNERAPHLRRLRLKVSAAAGDVRQLVLQKSDGTYLVALWRLASVWNRDRRRPLSVAPSRVSVALPDAEHVTVADPIASAAERPLQLHRKVAQIGLAWRPIVLHVTAHRVR
jgi:hypothetical protein